MDVKHSFSRPDFLQTVKSRCRLLSVLRQLHPSLVPPNRVPHLHRTVTSVYWIPVNHPVSPPSLTSTSSSSLHLHRWSRCSASVISSTCYSQLDKIIRDLASVERKDTEIHSTVVSRTLGSRRSNAGHRTRTEYPSWSHRCRIHSFLMRIVASERNKTSLRTYLQWGESNVDSFPCFSSKPTLVR